MQYVGTQQLVTERLVLRRFSVQDAPAMYTNWGSDPQVTKFMTWPTHTDPDISRQVLQDWCAQYADPAYYHWGIEIKEDHELIGGISVNRLDDFTQSATIGYCIGRPWWGQGFVTEAFDAVLGFLFDVVGTRCVNACHDPHNPASGRVMQKCGLRQEGVWRGGGKNNQGVCDEVWYSILDTEYAAHRQVPHWDIWDTLYQQARAASPPASRPVRSPQPF